MYNFGAPKIGNWKFAQLYDKSVPISFRVATDGDIVCGLPPTMNYFHIGTEVLIDPQGAGSIIIDPSFVERRLRTRVSTSISVHAMSFYQIGLERIIQSSKLMYSGNSNTFGNLPFDEVVNWESCDHMLELSDYFEDHPGNSPFVPLSQDSHHEKDVEWNNQLDISETSGPLNSAKLQSNLPTTSTSSILTLPSWKIFQRFRMNQDEMNEILVSKIPRRILPNEDTEEKIHKDVDGSSSLRRSCQTE